MKSYEIYKSDLEEIITDLKNIAEEIEDSSRLYKIINKLQDSSWEITNND